MSSPPFDIAEGVPASTDPVSNFPAAEHTFRGLVIDIVNREHDLPATGGSALHKFGVGSTATRDGTTDWVVGSLYFNTITNPETIQLCVAVGPVTWRDLNPASSVTTGANTFTATQTIKSTDAGAGVGPDLVLDRDSASPAASDLIGRLLFQGNDSGAADQNYASVVGKILDTTAGSEDAALLLKTAIAGTDTAIITAGPGVQIGSPTGADKGAGTLNATALYDDGVQLLAATQAEMEAETAGEGKFAVAARVKNHPGVAKAWVKFAGATGTLTSSYNTTSTSRSATGTYTWTIATDFSSADWVPLISIKNTTGQDWNYVITAQTAGSLTFETRHSGPDDPASVYCAGFGDQ